MAPSYPSLVASRAWEDLKRACRGACTDRDISEKDRTINLPGGGSIAVRSASDPDSLRGAGLDGLVLDEAAFLSVEAWETALRPALVDRQGWATLCSTPNGHNWFYELYEAAATRDGWARWQRPSIENPINTAEEMADAELGMGPRKFAQEHLADFVSIEGALWPAEYFGEHIWADRWPERFEVSAIAIDPSIGATEHSDYSAIVFVGLSGGLLWVDASIERRHPGKIVSDGALWFERFNPTAFGIEGNAFQALLRPLFDTHCIEEGLAPIPMSLITNSEKKAVRIQRLDPHLANQKIRLRRNAGCKMLRDQMLFYPHKDYHDDGPDALEMAIRLLRQVQRLAEADQDLEMVAA